MGLFLCLVRQDESCFDVMLSDVFCKSWLIGRGIKRVCSDFECDFPFFQSGERNDGEIISFCHLF